jgi:hypothetical protein
VTTDERHESAVAQTLRWAQEAAARGRADEALEWAQLIELMDGGLPPDWEPARQCWRELAFEQRDRAEALGTRR